MKIEKVGKKTTYRLEISIKHKTIYIHVFRNFNLFTADYTYFYLLLEGGFGAYLLSIMINNKSLLNVYFK